jgi:hypothetical protein
MVVSKAIISSSKPSHDIPTWCLISITLCKAQAGDLILLASYSNGGNSLVGTVPPSRTLPNLKKAKFHQQERRSSPHHPQHTHSSLGIRQLSLCQWKHYPPHLFKNCCPSSPYHPQHTHSSQGIQQLSLCWCKHCPPHLLKYGWDRGRS